MDIVFSINEVIGSVFKRGEKMQLKNQDNNPQPNSSYPNDNPQPASPYGANQSPYGAGSKQPTSPYAGNNVQPVSPYSSTTQQGSPYGSAPQQGSPYGSAPQQGSPYGSTPQQMPMYGNGNYDQPVIKEKSGFPVWVVILIIVLLLGTVGYFVFGKFSDIFGKADYTPGVVTGNVYQNDYFEFKTAFGSGWEITKDIYDPELVKKSLDSKQVVTELGAENRLSAEAFDFSVQQTAYNLKAVGTDMDKVLDAMQSSFVNELEQGGYKISSIEKDSMTIAGKTCKGFKVTGKMNAVDVELSMVQFYMVKGNYVGAFSAASTSQGKSKLIITNNVKELTE